MSELELSVAELLLYQAQVKTEIFNNLCQHTASQCDLNLSEIIRRCTCGVAILGVHAKRLPTQRADDNTPSVCYGWWGELQSNYLDNMLTLVHEWNYNSLKCLAVVNDGYHILYITLRQLPVSQVLFFVAHCLLPVPANKTHIVTGKDVPVVCSLTCSLNGCNYYWLLATFNLENRGLLWTTLRVFILGPML